MTQGTQKQNTSSHAHKKVPVKVGDGGTAAKKNGASSANDEAENRAKARKGALFLGFVVIVYVLYLIFSGQMGQFIAALGSVDLGWISMAALCFVFYFLFGVIAYAIAVYLDHDSPVGVRDLMSVEASGIFLAT